MNYFRQSNWYSTIKTVTYHLLRIYKRVSNAAQLPTKSDQVAEARKMKGEPKFSLQLHQNKGENKIKKSKLLA